MKINYKNTALNLLEKWDEDISIPPGQKPMTEQQKKEFGASLLRHLESAGSELFGKKVRYVSKSFIDAYYKAKHKLVDVFDKEEFEDAGTLIWSVGSWTHTNFYYLKTMVIDGIWTADYAFIQFSKHAKNDFKGLDVCISGTMGEEKTFIYKEHYDHGYDHAFYFAFLVGFITFIKHVDLETKVVNRKSRGHHAGEKYVNETNKNIEILDSTWFTTIVRSEGFTVGGDTGGFFRMQPWGPGNSLRKLIWVDPFQKQGYTRKAKILNQ